MEEFPNTRISVVIPTYNRAATITGSIESALNQTYPVSEIIIVDDASTDNTGQTVQALGDDRIRYFCLDKNKGAGGARNYGVSQARYDMIAFLDSDDTWHSDKIEKQVLLKSSNNDLRLIYTAYARIYDSFSETFPDMSEGNKLDGDILARILCENAVGTPTILMEKNLFEEIGGFDESLRSLEDWDLVIRAAAKTPFGFVPEVLVDAMFLNDGITSDLDEYFRSRCLMMQKYRQDYLDTDTFNISAAGILTMAQQFNMLEKVQSMLLQYISS